MQALSSQQSPNPKLTKWSPATLLNSFAFAWVSTCAINLNQPSVFASNPSPPPICKCARSPTRPAVTRQWWIDHHRGRLQYQSHSTAVHQQRLQQEMRQYLCATFLWHRARCCVGCHGDKPLSLKQRPVGSPTHCGSREVQAQQIRCSIQPGRHRFLAHCL